MQRKSTFKIRSIHATTGRPVTPRSGCTATLGAGNLDYGGGNHCVERQKYVKGTDGCCRRVILAEFLMFMLRS